MAALLLMQHEKFPMRNIHSILIVVLSLLVTASTCKKMEPGDYRDFSGNKINLIGCWALSEVQYKTAGVIESHTVVPESVMEFAENNRSISEDDPMYERGKTYYFHVIDGNTIYSEENVSSNSVLVNYYVRTTINNQ